MECKTSGSRRGSDGHSGRQRIYVTPRGSLVSPLLGSITQSLKILYPKVLTNLTLDVKMEIIGSFESLITICQWKWRNIPEDLALHSNGLINGLGKT